MELGGGKQSFQGRTHDEDLDQQVVFVPGVQPQALQDYGSFAQTVYLHLDVQHLTAVPVVEGGNDPAVSLTAWKLHRGAPGYHAVRKLEAEDAQGGLSGGSGVVGGCRQLRPELIVPGSLG